MFEALATTDNGSSSAGDRPGGPPVPALHHRLQHLRLPRPHRLPGRGHHQVPCGLPGVIMDLICTYSKRAEDTPDILKPPLRQVPDGAPAAAQRAGGPAGVPDDGLQAPDPAPHRPGGRGRGQPATPHPRTGGRSLLRELRAGLPQLDDVRDEGDRAAAADGRDVLAAGVHPVGHREPHRPGRGLLELRRDEARQLSRDLAHSDHPPERPGQDHPRHQHRHHEPLHHHQAAQDLPHQAAADGEAAVAVRAANESSRRFHNHGESP